MADSNGGSRAIPSGYDYDFVSPIDEDYVCQICHLPLKKAVLTRCGHRFCNDCLLESFRRRRQPECPCDREKIDKDKDIFPDKASERRILSYLVRCPCPGCQWMGELREVQNHEERCPDKVVECPSQNCTFKVARRLIEDHLMTSCLWRIVCCPFCSENYPKSQELAHNEGCAFYPLNCINGCTQVIPRMQMPHHLETDCLLTPLACPYHELGCTAKVERRDIERHIHDQTVSHLSLACKKIVTLHKEFDKEKTGLSKQLDELKKENDSLLLKVSAISKIRTDSPTYVWKISGFSEILRQAKHGRNNKLDSKPFYTETYGYKLKMSVNPNGDGSGKNTHLSVFVIVMKGDYDGMLYWPFNQKVTFILVDQQDSAEERENIVMHFKANAKLENFSRPTSDENPGRGYARFVSHEKLKSRRYIADDTLYLQVVVSPPSP